MNLKEFMRVDENEKPFDRMVTDGGYCSIFRTIACVGDSLASGEFESKTKDGKGAVHDFFEYSWGQFIARSCGAKVYNFSRGGMTAKEYVEEFAAKNGYWNREKVAQAYVIALGVNDLLGRKVPLGSIEDVCLGDYTKNAPTFYGYYAQIIQRYKQLQPRAKFFLVTIPREDDKDDVIRKQQKDALEELSKLFNRTYLIDLYTYAPAYDEEFKKLYYRGHLTPTGYVLTAKMIESYIDYLIRKNPHDFSQVGLIGTDFYFDDEED
jgi:lysophospholipase L1-like esterase